MRCQLLATLLSLFLAGCEPPPQAQPLSPPPASTGGAPPSVAVPSVATGTWTQTEVETFLREELAITTMSLRSTGGHNYQGTGTDKDGIAYTLVVKQAPGGVRVDWSHSTGNGLITFGKPVP
jgi:hypothetical protein